MEADAILEELARLATSEQFSRSKRLLRFLHFTVQRTLGGGGETLSEYLIGREVYDRSENFDPLTDGIVRVEAHRLRAKLREYYRSSGRQDPIIIEYPVGSYVPVFRRWAPEFLPPNGQMADAIRTHDWSASPLGPMINWPRELRSAVGLCLQMKFPAAIFWGKDFIFFYNDTMHALMDREGTQHIGQRMADFDPESWTMIQPAMQKVLETGEAILWEKAPWMSRQMGMLRECYFTTSYSPILDASGGTAGVLLVASDVTNSILYQRRSQTLADFAHAAPLASDNDACREAARILEQNPYDIPFASIYLFDPTRSNAEFRAGAGIQPGTGVSPERISLHGSYQSLTPAVVSGRPEVLDVGRHFGPLPSGGWEVPPRELVVMPLRATREREFIGVIVAGVNAHRPMDAEYRSFFEAVSRQISILILRARTYGRERKLSEEMEQQRRTWASFVDFANDEFRAPLTLTLGLLDQVLHEPNTDGTRQPAQFSGIRRGTLQLWNAVDTLTDLIRAQTDRLQPLFEPVDLCAVTEEIAKAFATELARPNISFSWDCPSLGEVVYVDRRMWDRLILSLLVGAVHRTENGEIGVSIRKIGAWIDTVVWDTGASISEDEQAHIFEPAESKSALLRRAGAGLALARHFAARHGGHMTVESESGKGSKFIVSIPRGRSHVGPERVMEKRDDVRYGVSAIDAYVENAMRWMPGRDLETSMEAEPAWRGRQLVPERRRRVLVAVSDRNLRQYLVSALEKIYIAEDMSDGQAALDRLRRSPPDLLLADTELHGIDGLDVVRAVRADSAIGFLPVVLMSSDSSEEERLRAFGAGASDYLVKPFSAPELLVRLEAQIALAETHKRTAKNNAGTLKDEAQLSFLRAVVDQLPIGVAIADRTSREIVLKNQRIRELFGNSADLVNKLEDIPETFGARLDGTPLVRGDCALLRAAEYGEIVIDEAVIYHLEDGKRLPVAVSASPIRDTAGLHVGAVVLYRPILD